MTTWSYTYNGITIKWIEGEGYSPQLELDL